MSFALAHRSKNKIGSDKASTPAKHSSYDHINSLKTRDSSNSILYLQPAIGNQAMHSVMRSSNTAGGFDFAKIGILQPKLKVSQPGDAYEQEADRVADQVMRMHVDSSSDFSSLPKDSEKIDRRCSTCEMGKKKEDDDEKQLKINRKASSITSNFEASDETLDDVGNIHSSGSSSLDASSKEFMESRFGFDFSKVRIHSDKGAELSTRLVSALAYTEGNDVFFAKGQYEPSTWQGKRLLAHELTHVVQQTNLSNLGFGTSIHPDLNISNSKEIAVARKPASADIRTEEGEPMTIYVNEYPVVNVWNLGPDEIQQEIEESEDGWNVMIYIPDIEESTAYADQDNIDLLTDQQVFVYVRFGPRMRTDLRSSLETGEAKVENLGAPHLGGRPYMNVAEIEAEEAERTGRKFIKLVEDIEKNRVSLEYVEEDLKAIRDKLSVQHVKRLEKEVLLWPRYIYKPNLRRIIEILTDVTRKSEIEESQRGLFPEEQGEAIKQEISESATQEYVELECLKFIYDSAVFKLYADEEEKVRTAQSGYKKGLQKRIETLGRNVYHTETLSRLASELRLQGLLGPVNLLKWFGKKNTYEPHPADLFDSLSGAGNGWYFFLVSMSSIHTFVIAVHVSGGNNRKYFKIQNGEAYTKTREGLKNYFVDHAAYGVDSRVWQVYLQSTE